MNNYNTQQNPKPNPLNLMDELCEDNLQDQLSARGVGPLNFNHGVSPGKNKSIYSPRYSMISNSQFYNYQPSQPYLMNEELRNSSTTPSNYFNNGGQSFQFQGGFNSHRMSQSPQKLNTSHNNSQFKIQLMQNSEMQVMESSARSSAAIDGQAVLDNLRQIQNLSQKSPDQSQKSPNQKLQIQEEDIQIQPALSSHDKSPAIIITNTDLEAKDALIIQLQTQLLQCEELLKERFMEIHLLQEDLDNLKMLLTEKDEQLDEFQDQFEIMEKEIQQLKDSKDQMSEDFGKQLQMIQESSKDNFRDIQSLRKQNLALKTQNQASVKQLQYQLVQLTKDNQKLKIKIRQLENQNEELLESMITQKQQQAAEKNHLHLQLSSVEESLISLKLASAQITMDRDFLTIKLKELERQNSDLKCHVQEVKSKAKIKQLEQTSIKIPQRESKNIFNKDRRTLQRMQDSQRLNRNID